MSTTLDINLYSNLDMNTVHNIFSYVPLSVQSKISKQMYDKIAPIAINKIIKAIIYHRNRMNMIMEYELPISETFIKAHYILHYPNEYRHYYCIRAMRTMNNMGGNVDLFMSTIKIDHTVNEKKIFNKMINQMSVETIMLNGW